MVKKKTKHGYQTVVSWHIEKPLMVKPAITGKKIIDGIKYYTGPGGKLYVKSIFDKIFNTI